MPVFKFRAFNKDKQLINGVVEADDNNSAGDTLEDKGYQVISLIEQNTSKFNLNITIGGIKQKEVVIFSRQFAVLVSANVALVHSLKLLVGQVSNPKFKTIIAEIADEVDGGARLSDALGNRPEVFSSFYVNVVKSGETAGKLDEVLNYLADELEKDYDMNSKIRGAMIYPASVIALLALVGTVMMIFVVPKLTEIITSEGGELPTPTKILVATSKFLSAYWYVVLLILIGIGVGIKVMKDKPVGKKILDETLLRLPIFGNLYKKIYLVRFARSMHTLIIGGVSISRGLEITADVVSNTVYKELILKTKQEVEDGNSISSVFEHSAEVPPMVSQMMAIGERTGRLDIILSKISDFYTREVNNIIANLMTLLEPIVIIVIGVGVGLMVAAIIMPIYSMSANF